MPPKRIALLIVVVFLGGCSGPGDAADATDPVSSPSSASSSASEFREPNASAPAADPIDPPGFGYDGNSSSFTMTDPPEDLVFNLTKNWTSATLTLELVKDNGQRCAVLVVEPDPQESQPLMGPNATVFPWRAATMSASWTSPLEDCVTPGGSEIPGTKRTIDIETRSHGSRGAWMIEFAGLGANLHVHATLTNP